METVILNGARSGDSKADEVCEVLASVLQGSGTVQVFKLREMKIADCLGCFGCWVKPRVNASSTIQDGLWRASLDPQI